MKDIQTAYVTGPEAAKILGITAVGVAQLIRQGKIPAVKMANRWLIPREFVEEYARTYHGRRGRPRKKVRRGSPPQRTVAKVSPTEQAAENLAPVAQTKEAGAEPESAAGEDFAINVSIDRVDANYDFELYEKGRITEHARLIVARLKPKIATLPHFSFRWDYRYDHLNVDIHGVGTTERDWFRQGLRGYGGHLPRRLSDPEHTFEVSIWMPGTHVFRGTMSFVVRKYAEPVEETPSAPTLGDRLRKWRLRFGR